MSYKEKEIKKLYWTVGEVSEMLGVPPSAIRFWLRTFDLDKDIKRGKSHDRQRMFTSSDVATLTEIHRLIHLERYRIEGAKRQLMKYKALAGHSKAEIENVLNPMP